MAGHPRRFASMAAARHVAPTTACASSADRPAGVHSARAHLPPAPTPLHNGLEGGDLATARCAAGVQRGAAVARADERRQEVYEQTKQRGASRGVKLVQTVEFRGVWRGRALAASRSRGACADHWLEQRHMDRAPATLGAWQASGPELAAGDHAPGHAATAVRRVGRSLISRPPEAPELGAAARVAEVLRRPADGAIERPATAVEARLRWWAADPVLTSVSLTRWLNLDLGYPRQPPTGIGDRTYAVRTAAG